MKSKKIIYLLVLPILNLIVLLFLLEVIESFIVVLSSVVLFYLFHSLKISKKYKKKGLNSLFILFYLAILFFPTSHFISYKINDNNYYLSDYLKESAHNRLENEKQYNQFSTLNYEVVKNSLSKENDSILNKLKLFKSIELNYLDSISLSVPEHHKKTKGLSGGGLAPPKYYLTLHRNNDRIDIIHHRNSTIRETLENYLDDYYSFYERSKDVKKEIGFVDFWFASISSFKFSEIIPNTYLTKSLWLFQSIISFILLFYISTNIPQLRINKR
ncbi:hypothetical protein [Winogradskyella sp. 3972H.M.0a.05]|uniref:hypothetical protein n=1 Tax=Winogradskyella sp. 3972H.M.0a.05 TaxID=2950277 RepID=UPI00339AE591